MVEKIPADAVANDPFIFWELVMKETYNLEELYKRLQEFLIAEDWEDLFTGKGDFETYYYQQDGGVQNHMICWRAARKPDNDAGGFIRFYLKLDIFTLALKKKEIMHKGKKVTLDSGEVKFKASFYLTKNNQRTKDGKDAWTTHPILKHFKKKFWDRWNSRAESEAKKELIAASRDLYELLQIYTGTMVKDKGPQDFLPPKGASF